MHLFFFLEFETVAEENGFVLFYFDVNNNGVEELGFNIYVL